MQVMVLIFSAVFIVAVIFFHVCGKVRTSLPIFAAGAQNRRSVGTRDCIAELLNLLPTFLYQKGWVVLYGCTQILCGCAVRWATVPTCDQTADRCISHCCRSTEAAGYCCCVSLC